MANTQQGLPGVPGVAMVGPDGIPTQGWYSFFLNLWQRTGGASGGASAILDQITSVVGSMLYRATNGWAGLAPSTQYKVLRMGASVPEWDTLDGNSFGSQSANEVFASPNGLSGIPSFRSVVGADFGSQTANEFLVAPNGSSGTPIFRTIATADLDSTAGQYPGTATNDNASAGNIGEYVTSGYISGVSLSSLTPVNIASIPLTAGDWDVFGVIELTPAPSTVPTAIEGVFSFTSASLTPIETGNVTQLVLTFTAGGLIALAMPHTRVSVTAPTTVYLNMNQTFTNSTATGSGIVKARRAR